VSDDLRFDQLLREDASGLPPAMADVNPWREAMWLVLWGMGLTTITFHFLYLDLLLPALGGILMVRTKPCDGAGGCPSSSPRCAVRPSCWRPCRWM